MGVYNSLFLQQNMNCRSLLCFLVLAAWLTPVHGRHGPPSLVSALSMRGLEHVLTNGNAMLQVEAREHVDNYPPISGHKDGAKYTANGWNLIIGLGNLHIR